MSASYDHKQNQTREPLPEGMEYCQVTGKPTPADEIVEFQGFRASAEGKMEILRRLRAGLPMPGELETCTIGARVVAMMVDGFVIGVFALLGGLILGYNLFTQEALDQSGEGDMALFRLQGAVNLTVAVMSLAYYTIMHGMRGQTLGKIAARIIVVNQDGSALNYRRAGFRAFCYQGVGLAAPISMLILTDEVGVTMAVGAFSILAGLWGLAEIIMALLDKAEQKSLHDRLASTRVVVKI